MEECNTRFRSFHVLSLVIFVGRMSRVPAGYLSIPQNLPLGLR